MRDRRKHGSIWYLDQRWPFVESAQVQQRKTHSQKRVQHPACRIVASGSVVIDSAAASAEVVVTAGMADEERG